MSVKESGIKTIVPYIPFKTLKGLIERLHNTVVPPAIDSSVLHSMSGSMRSQLMSALRFLGLTNGDGVVTDKLKGLVKAYKTETWAQTLSDVIFEAYPAVIGDVDLDTGTDAQLDNAFRKRGNVDGQMLDKATRFFLAALTEAGVAYSPHFGARKAPQRSTSSRKAAVKKKSPSKGEVAETDEGVDEEADTPADMEKFRFPIRGKGHGLIVFPSEMDKGDWAIVRKMLDAYFGVGDAN